MSKLTTSLWNAAFTGNVPEILMDCCGNQDAYNIKRQVFNRRFQFKPTAIVFCESAEQVSEVLLLADKFNYDIRVRSGGHDHEGESCATDTIVIDLSKMKNVEVDHTLKVARIQPGVIFNELVPVLNNNNVGIPHGTCGTVGIPGFTMGGGWGPWTRQKGMCCEHLVGATIVLGDGSIKYLTEDGEDKQLLWALRGGGGMSYGIVTELVIKTFPLPPNTIKFNVVWEDAPGLKVLELWEGLIAPDQNYNLLGTNLKIMAKPSCNQSVETSIHECVFYGYYAGSTESLREDMDVWFANLRPTSINIPEEDDKNDLIGFSAWDRISTASRKMNLKGFDNLTFIPPDLDDPAPHKISSRLVKEEGLGDEGRKNLIRSLESNLIYAAGDEAGVHCYVTLGAITGDYYKKYKPEEHPLGSAFPYKKRPYTIQYQVWWNANPEDIEKGKEHDVYRYTNEALDWIEQCREAYFPQTEGSFISFKDSSIPTKNYFLDSYEPLKNIKLTYSKDPKNRFRSRKTII